MNKYWGNWEKFWFSQYSLFGLSLFRFLFSAVVLIMYSLRICEFDLFYSNQGLLQESSLQEYLPEYLRPAWILFSSNETLSFSLHILFLGLMLLMFLGLANRGVTLVIFLLHLSFLQRNPAILYGADLVASFWFFYLCFVKHNQFFSLRHDLPFLDKAKSKIKKTDLLGSVGLRLIQIQLCVIYAYTGMEKLKGSTWWEGSAVWHVMGNESIVPFDFSYFQHVPWLVAIMTFSTLIFEIYFPMAVWMASLKRMWLFVGLALHGLSAFFMGLFFFAPIMLSPYVLFIDPEYLQKKMTSLRLPQPVVNFIRAKA